MTSDQPGGPDDGLSRRQQREAATTTVAGEAPGAGAAPEPADAPAAAPATTSAEVEETKRLTPQQRNLVEWVGVIGGAIVIAVVVRLFFFQTFWIPSPSMSPTLVRNDRVLVNKLSYKLHDVHRGDVVVFKRPPYETDTTVKDLIKRVIGLPGERISVVDSVVKINGKALKEPYTHGLPSVYQPGCGSGPVTGIDTEKGLLIPAHHIFVMGDNRVNSSDSRCFGPIDEDLVVGRAFFIMWPPSKIGGL